MYASYNILQYNADNNSKHLHVAFYNNNFLLLLLVTEK